MKAQIIERTQKSVGSGSGGFGGPDRYVVVVAYPDHMPPLSHNTPLHRERLEAKGYTIYHCGEGYSRNTKSPRSALSRARARAEEIFKWIINGGEEQP